MPERTAVEVELRVAEFALAHDLHRQALLLRSAVGADGVGEVALAHVVGDDRKIGAAKARLCQRQIARRGPKRLGRIEAFVGSASLRLKPPDERALATSSRCSDPAGQPPAGRKVYTHAEELAAGPGHDLGEPDRFRGVAPGHRIDAPAAL